MKLWKSLGFGVLLLGVLGSCSTRTINAESFSNVPLGATPKEVEATLGAPDETGKTPEGYLEYTYIERITLGPENREQVHYFIRFSDGKVVEKAVEEIDPLAPIYFYTP